MIIDLHTRSERLTDQITMPSSPKGGQQQPQRPPAAAASASATGGRQGPQSVVSSSTTRVRQDALGGQVSSSSLWPSAGSLWVPAWQEPYINLFSTLQIHRLAQMMERQERLQGGASSADSSSDKQTTVSGTKSSKEGDMTTVDRQTMGGESSSKMSQSMRSPEWAAKHVMRRKGNVHRIMVRLVVVVYVYMCVCVCGKG